MEEKELRERAKALGIRNWHNRKIDKLRELVKAQDATTMKESEVVISFDSFFATASDEVKAQAVLYLDSIEALSKNIDFCLWLEDQARLGRFVTGTSLDVVWRFWNKEYPYAVFDEFLDTLECFVFLARNWGWCIEDEVLYWDSIPSLLPSWHAKRWVELSCAIDRERAKTVFGLLFGVE